jgi:hypothetical protein
MSADLHREFAVLINEYVNATRRIEGMPPLPARTLALLDVRDIWLATGQLLISILEMVRDQDVRLECVDAAIWRELGPILHSDHEVKTFVGAMYPKVQ